MKYSIISLLLLAGCGTNYKMESPKNPLLLGYSISNDINNEVFEPYIEEYLYERGETSIKSVVRFQASTESFVVGVNGVCKTWEGIRYSVVVIDQNIWYLLSEIGKLAILSHELLHCEEGLKHSSTSSKCDGSIMNAFTNCTIQALVKNENAIKEAK